MYQTRPNAALDSSRTKSDGRFMEAVNPILRNIARTLIEAMFSHVKKDRQAVEAALQRASDHTHVLMDSVGDAMGTMIGDNAMFLFSEVESIDLNDEPKAIFNSLCFALELTMKVSIIANGPNPFEPIPGADRPEGEAIVPVVTPASIVRT